MRQLSTAEILKLLEEGALETEGLISWGSNYTFLARVCYQTRELNAIYKPRKGERPLWDFAPGTLCLRERAAFLVSEGLGWALVPATVLRDGPHGWGSVQRFVEHDPDEHYFTIQEEETYAGQLQQVVLFDLLVNNADRKGGHVLVGDGGRLWSIDHGICFHSDYKLRSVIWEFAGEPIPKRLRQDLEHFKERLASEDEELADQLGALLNDREMEALRERVARLLKQERFPHPGPGRHYPWPPV
ncbi:MAG: SCO1664 family protein [Candidatus Promineifilaceae bacterium]|nr:SCO1664 family protein [Candidatus Promineifilaceae bacterium]